jgi:hypothetical protein
VEGADHSIGHYREGLRAWRIGRVKTLYTAVLAVVVGGAVVAGAAAADSNDLTFTQAQGADGRYQIDIGVSYVFPGMPPRTANSGVGTVRFTLPGADLALDPAQPPDVGYVCVAAGESATCSSEGQQQGDGLAFPTSMTVHLVAKACWTGTGNADVWAAPNDPGTAPDVTLPIQASDCPVDSGRQPLLEGHAPKCRVSKLTGVSLASATRRLKNAHCSRGKVKYGRSARIKHGRVISQSVKPGRVLNERAKVNLVVAR